MGIKLFSLYVKTVIIPINLFLLVLKLFILLFYYINRQQCNIVCKWLLIKNGTININTISIEARKINFLTFVYFGTNCCSFIMLLYLDQQKIMLGSYIK